MATVVELRDLDGSLLGTCDARCHTAKGPKCKCICGGINHGVGLRQAIENEGFLTLAEDARHKYVTRVFQRRLFTPEQGEQTR